MKKILSIILIIALVLSFVACGKKANDETVKDDGSIVETDKIENEKVELLDKEESSEDKKDETTENKPVSKPAENKPQVKPEAKPEEKPQSKPEAAPEKAPETKPEVTPEKEPENKDKAEPCALTLDNTFSPYEVVVDRIAAIRRAMEIAQKDDVIVLAGKGHETYQEIHGIKHHMDEREIVADILKEKRG